MQTKQSLLSLVSVYEKERFFAPVYICPKKRYNKNKFADIKKQQKRGKALGISSDTQREENALALYRT